LRICRVNCTKLQIALPLTGKEEPRINAKSTKKRIQAGFYGKKKLVFDALKRLENLMRELINNYIFV